ncbi:MAG: hypothetical protein IH596_14900 [Bacteroidales bacterium]|nr:hypothetical protein [Bacteroidales bacterium]
MFRPQIYCLLFLHLVLFSLPLHGYSQKRDHKSDIPNGILKYDTIHFKPGIYFIGPTEYFTFSKDTSIVIGSIRKLRAEEINKLRTESLYDTLYKKFGRSRLSKLLYNLAFVAPQISTMPDSIQTQEIEIPFRPYQGMYIRNIHIKSLDPFGSSIFDTSGVVQTGAAKFGNKVHLITQKSVIRNQLMFNTGEHLNADQIADNMRILQELPYLADARIVVTETSPGSDTVDIVVITKDTWSIGATFIAIDLTRYRGSLYDANFLGSGDRFSVFWSVNYKRAPFFRFDGLSYTFTNIGRSFIDATISLSQDDDGNQTLYTDLSRPFYSYSTRLAGGINFTFAKTSVPNSDGLYQIATYHQEGAWLGLSSQAIGADPATRLVLAQSVFFRNYISRPVVTIDSNTGYSNTTTFLTSLQLSRNKYYNTDYIFQFGKTEAFPYGYLGQITVGPAITDFYTRFYINIGASAGNFIKNFGYLLGKVSLGGYLHRDRFEDGLLKVESLFMSYLYFSKSKRFKFRSYINLRYNLLFNELETNHDYYDLAEAAKIPSVNTDSLFDGSQVGFLSFSTVAYTPWYFYGFRFALQGTVWAGLSAPKDKSLWQSKLMTGIGVGLLFRNDNLIFPTLIISCFIYPTTPGVPLIQFDLFETTNFEKKDFGPIAPYIQTMRN